MRILIIAERYLILSSDFCTVDKYNFFIYSLPPYLTTSFCFEHEKKKKIRDSLADKRLPLKARLGLNDVSLID